MQADGTEVTTIGGMASGGLRPLQALTAGHGSPREEE
jgi:hypothetical protein